MPESPGASDTPAMIEWRYEQRFVIMTMHAAGLLRMSQEPMHRRLMSYFVPILGPISDEHVIHLCTHYELYDTARVQEIVSQCTDVDAAIQRMNAHYQTSL